jgi:hypothetical protein
MTTTHPTLPFGSIHDLLGALAGIARIDGTGEQARLEVLDAAGFATV